MAAVRAHNVDSVHKFTTRGLDPNFQEHDTGGKYQEDVLVATVPFPSGPECTNVRGTGTPILRFNALPTELSRCLLILNT